MDRVMGPTTWGTMEHRRRGVWLGASAHGQGNGANNMGTVEHRRRVACDWGLQLMDRVMGPTTWGTVEHRRRGMWPVTLSYSLWA